MVNGGVQYRQSWSPAYARPQMGAIKDLGLKEWALLGGGAVVAAAGISGFIKGLPGKKRKLDVVALIVGGVVTLVGGTAFVDNFNRLTA
jgi:hypothetical protein